MLCPHWAPCIMQGSLYGKFQGCQIILCTKPASKNTTPACFSNVQLQNFFATWQTRSGTLVGFAHSQNDNAHMKSTKIKYSAYSVYSRRIYVWNWRRTPPTPPDKNSLSNKLFTLYAKPRKPGEGKIKNAFRGSTPLCRTLPTISLPLTRSACGDLHRLAQIYGENSAFAVIHQWPWLQSLSVFVCSPNWIFCAIFFWVFLLAHFKFHVVCI